ncbi:peptidylprolyl isomerase, partial [Pseudomonadales bacterium]|nr:peptidylprolyl isomerase [Pseudomonadales bacterium]
MLVARQYLKGAGKFSMRLLGLLGLVWGSGAMAADSVRVIIKTTQGAITLELDAKAAPATVANFLSYVDQSGYDNTIFHRVIEGFMIQGGGHYRDLAESPSGPSLRNEADNGLRNEVGTIAMARMAEIDSATNQFFINVADNRRLDHQGDSCSREEEAAAEARAE